MTAKNQYKNFQFNSSKKKSNKEYFKGIKAFFADERFHKTSGLFLVLISIYLFFSFTSYLFTWKYDLSIIDGKSIGFVFNGEESEIQNWLGKFGAYIAHRFLKIWYGVASYLFVLVFFVIGFKSLFKYELLPITKTLKVSFVSLIWLCTFLGFVFERSDLDFMGGLYGRVINNWLIGVFGQIGTGFFIFFFGISSVVLLFNPSLSWVVDFFNKFSKKIKENISDKDGFTIVPSDTETEQEVPDENTSLDLNVDSNEMEKELKSNETTSDSSDLELDVNISEEKPASKKEDNS